jgi:hypothetical protein
MTNNINNNDFDGLDEIQYEEESYTQGYPRIYWFNGVKQAQTGGKFYTSEKEFPQGLGQPWTPVQWFKDGDGYTADNLSIVPIRKRYQAYFETTEGTRKVKTWLPAGTYETGARIYTEILCHMQGYDGLVILAVKGMTGKALTNKTTGIFTQFKDTVVATAKETLKKGTKLPPFAFWVPITTERDSKNRINYTDTGHGSTVTLPSLDIKGEVTRAVAKGLYVGGDLLKTLADWYAEHNEWRTTYRTNELPLQGSAALPIIPAKNTPKPIEADDDEIWK